MVKCECGHEQCFHHLPVSGVSRMFGGGAPLKACNVKECQCLRFTPVDG